MLEAIISLGQKLEHHVPAEGIETGQQFDQLRRLGCELGQGFFFSEAVPGAEVPAILDRVASDWAS